MKTLIALAAALALTCSAGCGSSRSKSTAFRIAVILAEDLYDADVRGDSTEDLEDRLEFVTTAQLLLGEADAFLLDAETKITKELDSREAE